MMRLERIAAGLACGWIAFVILACTDTDAEVEGDLATSGRCPAGESCAPRGGGPRVFIAPLPRGAEPPTGELPPLATGAESWVRFVETSADGSDYLSIPGARIELDSAIGTPGSNGVATLLATDPGTFLIRAVDERGNLLDRTRVRVMDATVLVLRPSNFFVGPVGPATGWKVWPETRVRLSLEARSGDGEMLVTGEESFGVDAPASGVLEVEGGFGDSTVTARFPVARSVDAVVGYAPLSCEHESRDDLYCLFGVEGGSPISGVPFVVEDVDEDGAPTDFVLTGIECVGRRPEARTVTLSLDGRRWTQAIPAVGGSCTER